jgi:hypothetical protein
VSGPGEVRHPRSLGRQAQLVPGQYSALDALVEALRTLDRWLVYRAEALWDQPPKLDAGCGGCLRGREGEDGARGPGRGAAQGAGRPGGGAHRSGGVGGRGRLCSCPAPTRPRGPRGARAWQSQAEEKAKEAEGLKTTLADKAAVLAAAEEQLCQEQAARQQAEAQLQ